MNALSLVHFAAALFYVALGIVALSKGKGATMNRVYALFVSSYVIWNLAFVFFHAAASPEDAFFWLSVSSPGWCTFAPLYLCFTLLFVNRRRILRRWYFYPVAFGIPAISIYAQWAGNVCAPVVKTAYGWSHYWSDSIWAHAFAVHYVALIVVALSLLWSFSKQAKSPYQKKQAHLLLGAAVIPLLLGSLTDVVLPRMRIVAIPPLAPVFTAITAFGVLYAIGKYELLVLTPTYVIRNILSTMRESLVLIDWEGKIVEANGATLSLLGYGNRQEIVGRPAEDIFPEANSIVGEMLPLTDGPPGENGRCYRRVDYLAKDHSRIPMDLSLSVMRGESGDILAKVCVARDARETMRSELRRKALEQQLHESEKMAAVGQLAAGAAHEINNPVGVILGFAQGMEHRLSEGDSLRTPVTSIVREALRCKAIVQALLTFTRTGKPNLQPVDLNVVVRTGVKAIEAKAAAQRVSVRQDLEESLPAILGDQVQFEQILANLGANALDAMVSPGTLSLRTRREGTGTIVLEVADTGVGMPNEVRSRIFEPFFTTKDVGKGTGLGLSLVYEIVRQHGGTIDVESEVGKGTSMCVRLPAAVGGP